MTLLNRLVDLEAHQLLILVAGGDRVLALNSQFLVLLLFGSTAISSLSVWLSIKLAYKWGVLDHPDMYRKTQALPIPKLGGVAVATSFLLIGIPTLLIVGQRTALLGALGIFVPALGAAALGFLDDRRHLNPNLRLLCQATLASLAWVMGVRVDWFGVGIVDFLLFVFWVVAITNAVNLLDNSDGLAAGSVLLAAIGSVAIARISLQELVPILGVIVAGGAIGFLVYNWSPARVYLGDAGAYFLGFLLAVLVLEIDPVGTPRAVGVGISILLLVLPLLDTSFVVARRLANRSHPFTAGRDHLSHLLIDGGWSVPRSVLSLYLVQLLGVVTAVLMAQAYE